jgi:hypothetical protein
MADLSELLEGLDEDQAEAIMEQFKAVEEAANAKTLEASANARALRFASDEELFKQFPRVVSNIRGGNIDANGVPDDKLDEFLQAEEQRLERMGVPLPSTQATAPATQGTEQPTQQAQEPPPAPAQGWGRPVATGQAAPPNPSEAIVKAMTEGASVTDLLEAIHSAAAQDPSFRGPTGMDKVVAPFEARRPIRSS